MKSATRGRIASSAIRRPAMVYGETTRFAPACRSFASEPSALARPTMKRPGLIALADSDYVLPGLIDVHAHYNMTLGPNGVRSDEYTYNPLIFLANGVTTTFPAGEYDPEGMMETRKRIGFQVMIFLLVLSGLLYFTKKKVWADAH